MPWPPAQFLVQPPIETSREQKFTPQRIFVTIRGIEVLLCKYECANLYVKEEDYGQSEDQVSVKTKGKWLGAS